MTLAVAAALPWLLSIVCLAGCSRLERALTPHVFTIAVPVTMATLAGAALTATAALGAVALTSASTSAVAVGAALVLVVVWRLFTAAAHGMRVVSARRAVRPFCTHPARDGDLLVIDDDEPDAFATRGTVVVTEGMRVALRPEEFARLVEHERAHLRHRHSFWIQLCEFAVRLNPLDSRIIAAVRHAAERHADEVAAGGDRQLFARTLARASLAHARHTRQHGDCALRGSGGDVVRRIAALGGPAPRRSSRRAACALATAAVVASVLTPALADVVEDCFFPEPGEAPTAVFR